MARFRFTRRPYPEYIRKVHYQNMPGQTLCSIWKTSGSKTPEMTRRKEKVTCKICLKKLGLGIIEEHFEGDLFIL